VYSVLGNRFARVFTAVTAGWQAARGVVPTAEDVVRHLDEIEDERDYGIPRHVAHEMQLAGRARRDLEPDRIEETAEKESSRL
jgi:hypothetical protein